MAKYYCEDRGVLGPTDEIRYGPCEPPGMDDLVTHADRILRSMNMHYRNGREAKNGDKVVKFSIEGGRIEAVGVLHDAVPGNDYCNGRIAPTLTSVDGACMCDCLHADDVAAMLKEKGLDKRPPGK